MSRPVHIFNMLKQFLALVFLLASVTTVYCEDALQKTHPDNNTLQHQSKRAVSLSQYPVPYTAEIRHPMFDGKEIYIEGAMLQDSNRFTLDLCETKTCLQDIEMQADYRFNTQIFSMNYKRNLQWGPPSFNYGKLLEGGKAVKITVVIDSHQFKVLVNSKTFVLNVPARMTKIKNIRIRGEVKIDWILYSWNQPPKYFSFNQHLQQQRLVIIGYPTVASRFYFNFLHANQTSQTWDCGAQIIHVHFDSRFNMDGDRRKIYLNSRRNGRWGTPTYMPISNFPYQLNVTFRVQITLRQNQFQFLFNDKDSYNYARSTDGIQIICYHDNVVVQTIYTT